MSGEEYESDSVVNGNCLTKISSNNTSIVVNSDSLVAKVDSSSSVQSGNSSTTTTSSFVNSGNGSGVVIDNDLTLIESVWIDPKKIKKQMRLAHNKLKVLLTSQGGFIKTYHVQGMQMSSIRKNKC